MTLARKPLLKPTDDAVPLVDLRPLGAPVANYCSRVHRFVANGAVVPLDRECVAIVDTGTTGMVVSDTLLDTDAMPLPALQWERAGGGADRAWPRRHPQRRAPSSISRRHRTRARAVLSAARRELPADCRPGLASGGSTTRSASSPPRRRVERA